MQMSAAGTREAAAEATRGFFIRMKVASFIQPMACLPVLKLPDGPLWAYEVKLDGYRVIGVNPTQGALPKSTVVDGEFVALDDAGRPDFHLLLILENRHYAFVFTFSICRASRSRALRDCACSKGAIF